MEKEERPVSDIPGYNISSPLTGFIISSPSPVLELPELNPLNLVNPYYLILGGLFGITAFFSWKLRKWLKKIISPKKNQKIICITCRSQSFLDAIVPQIEELLSETKFDDIHVEKILIKDGPTNLHNAAMVMQVATKQSRNLYLSEKEDCPMNEPFASAKDLGASQFFIVAGDLTSQDLEEGLYSEEEFSYIFKGQPDLRKLSQEDRFISIGYPEGDPEDRKFKLNQEQRKAVKRWVASVQYEIP